MEDLGAKMEVGIQLRAELAPVDWLRTRAATKRRVKECQRCELFEFCEGPVPMRGPVDGVTAEVLVLGEAPGKQEDEQGLPFVGPAGKLMSALLTEVGFDLDRVAWANVISCLPNRTPPTPMVKEMKACRVNLRDQVVASGATYIVLAGSVATQSWRGDLKVSDVHGQVFLWGGTWVVMPVWHPAAALRDVLKKAPLKRDLRWFREVVTNDYGLRALGMNCVKCHHAVNHYDPDGVPYCRTHWQRYGNQWKKEWRQWDNDKARPPALTFEV